MLGWGKDKDEERSSKDRDTYRRDSQRHDDAPAREQGNDDRDSADSANKSGPY